MLLLLSDRCYWDQMEEEAVIVSEGVTDAAGKDDDDEVHCTVGSCFLLLPSPLSTD